MGGPSGPPLPSSALPEVDQLRAKVSESFPVYETRSGPRSLTLLVHADPATLEDRFDRLRQDLWDQFYIPQVRYSQGEYVIEIVRRPGRRPWNVAVNLTLMALTVASTAAAGAFLWLAYRGGTSLTLADFANGALYFAAPLMAILGLHEFAHYVVARRHHVEASLPYFIPVPPPYLIFGTFGAFISLREPIPNKKALLDIGAAGPLAGFAVAVPVTLGGLFLSLHAPVLPLSNCGPVILGANYGNIVLGTSAIFSLLSLFLPQSILNLHPLAIAGWVGLLVTSMNLLPAGQLDGGHVFRALLGDRSRYVSYAATGLLFALGIFYIGWIFFALLILLLGVRHPPPLNDISALGRKRWLVGAVVVAVLLGGFAPIPLGAPSNGFSVPVHYSTNLTPPTGYALAGTATLVIHNTDFIPHGYTVSAEVVSVRLNNSSSYLTGPALAAYEANSTWSYTLPNGSTGRTSGSGNMSLASGTYIEVGGSASATVAVRYLNSQPAEVTFAVTLSQLCSSTGASSSGRFVFTVS